MFVESAPIAAALTVTAAVIRFSRSVAGALAHEDRRMANRLAVVVAKIGSNAVDISEFLRGAKRARTRKMKDELLGMALKRTELTLLLVRDLVRMLDLIWYRPTLMTKIVRRLKRRH